MTPFREPVDAKDAAEDIDQDRFHLRIGDQDAKGVLDLLGARAAAHVEKVRGSSARVMDDVHRRHRETGAVHHAADASVELDVVQGEPGGFHFERRLFGQVAELLHVGVAKQSVVVDGDLRVESHHFLLPRHQERIDLDETSRRGNETPGRARAGSAPRSCARRRRGRARTRDAGPDGASCRARDRSPPAGSSPGSRRRLSRSPSRPPGSRWRWASRANDRRGS